MKKLRTAVAILSTLIVLLLGYNALFFYTILGPNAFPELYASYESPEGTQTWTGTAESYTFGQWFGNLLGSSSGGGGRPDPKSFSHSGN